MHRMHIKWEIANMKTMLSGANGFHMTRFPAHFHIINFILHAEKRELKII